MIQARGKGYVISTPGVMRRYRQTIPRCVAIYMFVYSSANIYSSMSPDLCGKIAFPIRCHHSATDVRAKCPLIYIKNEVYCKLKSCTVVYFGLINA